MKGIHLGELEELILLTIAMLDDDAYGVSVQERLYQCASRQVNISAVHTVMHRMEKKGLVRSKFGPSLAIRGGRRKRLFSLTPSGLKALQEIRMVRNRMYENLPGFDFKISLNITHA